MGIVAPGAWMAGMQLPIQSLSRAIADPWEETANVADLVAVAQRAEAAGLAFVGVCDHVAIPRGEIADRMGTTWFDTVATLGFLAAHTTTVRLMSEVWVAAYRHPLQTASSFGTLDHLSGGRVVLGVGAGHVEGEFDALGVPFAERGALLDEALAALAGGWDREFASFAGERLRYDDAGVGPRPVAGRLPVWIGGSGRRAWERVGRFGDGYIPMGNPVAQYAEIRDVVQASAEAAGRPDAAFDLGFMPAGAHLTGGPADAFPPGTVFTADAMADQIRAARTAGANVMHVRFRGRSLAEYLEQIDAFAETVVPLVDRP